MSKQKFSFWLFAFSTIMFVWLFLVFLKPFVVASLLVLATLVFAKRIESSLSVSKISLIAESKELISASILTLIFGIVIFAPVGYFIVYAVGDIGKFDISSVFTAKTKIELLINNNGFLSISIKNKILDYLNTIYSEDFWILEAKNIFTGVSGFLKGIASSLVELVMIVVFFFLLHWFKSDIGSFIKSLVPVDDADKESIAREMVSAISVVFLTLLGVMVAQGLAFFALLLFFDYNAPLLGFLCALASVVPVFGTALVWIPIAVSEFIKGNILNAIIISAYSWFIMAFLIDNFLRLFLLAKVTKMLKSDYKINEFLIFFSIAAGIAAFGFWGFIIGPSITALFLSSAKLYKNLK
jgi:predicted PurR-regulated permease PerM